MKKFCCLIIFGCVSLSVNAQYSLFDNSYLHEIRITSTDPNFWQTLGDDWDAGGDIPYHTTTVEIDGNELLEVGVRQKGFSSNFFVSTTKKPLKLKFNEFIEDREFDGVRKLNLMNGVGDPAIIKDKIAYEMFRFHGVPGPRVAHTKLYINDVYWGVYGMIEQIDKRYLKRNFADNDGNLWKNDGNSDLSWLGNDPNDYTFDLQTNENDNDWSKFLGFVDFINNATDIEFENDFTDIFHLDEYLRIVAIDILINNWDSYLDHGRNWYMYHEPRSDKIHWIPWDYNFAFDRGTGGSGDLALIQNSLGKVLNNRIFNTPELRTRVMDYMCEILDYNFTNDRLTPMMDSQVALIEDDWDSSNNFFNFQTITNYINGTIWSSSQIGGPFQALKEFLVDRRSSIQNDLNNQGHTCAVLPNPVAALVINEFMADNDDDSPWSDQDGDFDDWIELYNNTNQAVNLSNYFLSDTSTFEHKWELPSVEIPANGYLIVWADKDVDQAGLHTQFSLDKDGGEVILSYLDGSVIDSVEYTEQSGNISMSRIPNGTGAFIATPVVTFESSNGINNDIIFADGFEN
ncbi:hypothetical protein MNBD_GAMMA02-125 [hydrothermal vent metagenome]|uniref:LTD domain-containing protein n=1 Tax=hydrothermal vent metagenome TaxID=652676 RepID=A0A3B0W8F9_9ZZZZ